MIKSKRNNVLYFSIFAVGLFIHSGMLYSQSPYYSIMFSIRELDRNENINFYKIERTTCQFEYDPLIPSGDYWFGKDTSLLDWANLPDSMISKLSCNSSDLTGLKYEYSSQAMVWENIFAIKIVRNITDTMIIVFPVKIKSFVTYIDLGSILFKTGIYDLTDIITYSFNQWLHIEIPANYKWLPETGNKGILKIINKKL